MERPPPTDQEIAAIFAGTLEATRTGVLVFDRDGRVLITNRRFTEMFAPIAAILDEGGLPAFDTALAQLLIEPVPPLGSNDPLSLDQEIAAIHLLRLNDGRVFEQFVSPYLTDGELAGRLVTFTDITRTVRAEAALASERAFLEKAQEVAHVGSWSVDLEGSGQLKWSAEMYRILGVSFDAKTSRTRAMAELVHPDDRERLGSARDAAIASGQPYEVEHRIIRPDGAIRWVHTSAEILRNASGRPARVVGTLQEVTVRRELEEQLRQAQKLEAVGRLAGGVAHDLNNALTAIIGYTELVLEAVDTTHPSHGDVVEIRRAAERAESVVRQLLAFSRRQHAEPRVFALDKAVVDIGRMLERLLSPTIQVSTIVAGNLPMAHGDPGQIEQAIMNLALNARDAMPDGGRFTLALELVEHDLAFVRSRPPMTPGSYLELTASDTGEGMSPDTLAHIFEPFFTTKDVGKGTGLGLSMVYGTVEQAGGCIVVESELGQGTTFRLYFPQARAAAVAAATQIAKVAPPPARPHLATVLVVDDQPQVRDIAAAALRRDGYRVLTASSGREALTLAGAKGARLDLLLTDASMPEMSGRELALLMLEVHPGLRILVMSGYSAESLGLTQLERGFGVLAKPFTQAALRNKVRELLATPATDS